MTAAPAAEGRGQLEVEGGTFLGDLIRNSPKP